MSQSWFLVIAYAAACSVWWGLNRVLPLWPETERPHFTHPWREVGIVLLAVGALLGLGQLWAHGIKLTARGAAMPVVESLNQIIIFAPVLAVPVLRRHGWASAWIRLDSLLVRIAVGVGVALFTLFLYSILRDGTLPWLELIRRVYAPTRAHLAVQVLLEDVAIAVLFVRLAAAVGRRGAILGVAALFAASHIPALITRGEPASEFVGLVRDFGLGVLVLGTLWRSADIAWFWPVHHALDMTQFLNRSA